MIEIESSRLLLKPVVMGDLQSIHQLHSFPEVDEFNTLGIPADIEESKVVVAGLVEDNSFEKVNNFTYSIFAKESDEFVGLVAIKLGNPKYRSAEIWYKLIPDFWNQGFATEVVSRILKFGFNELSLHRIEAGCAVDNNASIKVLENVGMQREGRKRAVLPLKSGWSDNFEYSILEWDFTI